MWDYLSLDDRKQLCINLRSFRWFKTDVEIKLFVLSSFWWPPLVSPYNGMGHKVCCSGSQTKLSDRSPYSPISHVQNSVVCFFWWNVWNRIDNHSTRRIVINFPLSAVIFVEQQTSEVGCEASGQNVPPSVLLHDVNEHKLTILPYQARKNFFCTSFWKTSRGNHNFIALLECFFILLFLEIAFSVTLRHANFFELTRELSAAFASNPGHSMDVNWTSLH